MIQLEMTKQRCWIRNEHHWMLSNLLLFVSPTISSPHFLKPPLHPRLRSILDASRRFLYCCGTECSFASAYIPSFIMTFPKDGILPFSFCVLLSTAPSFVFAEKEVLSVTFWSMSRRKLTFKDQCWWLDSIKCMPKTNWEGTKQRTEAVPVLKLLTI